MLLHQYLCDQKKANNSFREVQFAKSIGITKTYLWQVKTGYRTPSIKLAKKIENATNGKVNALKLIEKNYLMKSQLPQNKSLE